MNLLEIPITDPQGPDPEFPFFPEESPTDLQEPPIIGCCLTCGVSWCLPDQVDVCPACGSIKVLTRKED